MSLNFRSFVHFPIVLFILLPIGFFVCYGIAISNSHVSPLPTWPYVSDTGAYPPESCIFTLILTWGAFVFLAISFTYYKYVLFHGHVTKCNTAGLWIGFLIAFGMTMVGSFQWVNALIPHVIGAFVAFFGAVIYSGIIVYISWKFMRHSGYGNGIIYFRLALTIVELISLILLIASTTLAQTDKARFYNFSTISEWCLIYSAILFIGTMIYEMNNVRFMRTQLVLHSTPSTIVEAEENAFTTQNPV